MSTVIQRSLSFLLIGASTILGACASTSGSQEDPYVMFRELMPRSILILPPINESVDLNGTYSWLTTASQPVGEKGFYVFPVAIVDEFMKENGLPNPEDMHAAPLDKIGEIFGADAVMYVTLEQFGQKFEILQSVTRIVARAELVDVKTGQMLWRDRVVHSASNSNSSGSGLLGALVSATIEQVADTINDTSHDAARSANREMFARSGSGLLPGPTHPRFAEQMAAAAAAEAEADGEAEREILEEPLPAE